MIKLIQRSMEVKEKSEVEKFFDVIAAKFEVQKKFSELTPMEVNILCQGVSMILQVVHD